MEEESHEESSRNCPFEQEDAKEITNDESHMEVMVDPCDLLKIIRNKDGTITRVGYIPTVPPTGDNPDTDEAVITKDITLNEDKKTWIRLYLPIKLLSNNKNVATKLPIILFFHSGAFVIFSADTAMDNEPCTRFSKEVGTIVVSVNYRLAPENKLPAPYEDGEEAILWIKKQAIESNGEKWLKDYGDFSRLYVMGCSTGATCAYYTTLRAVSLDLEPVNISGLILNQPFFCGTKLTKSERKGVNDSIIPRSLTELIVELTLPVGSDADHEYLNPMVKGSHYENITKLPRCLVRGFKGDPLIDREMEFVRMLIRRGIPVTAHFGEIGFHVIDYIDPKRHLSMLGYMRDFII